MSIRFTNYILAFVFFASGAAKLLSLPFEVAAFERWGYPIEFMYFIGAVECFGAIGLFIRRLSSLVSLCLSLFMLGAIVTHLVHQEWSMLVVASVISITAFWRGWSGREDVKALFKAMRK